LTFPYTLNTDIFPTIVEILGEKNPIISEQFQGNSLINDNIKNRGIK